MKRFLSNESLRAQQFEVNHWPVSGSRDTSYEIVLIQAGSGSYQVNGNQSRYQAGDVFFLGPSDKYSFKISQKTCFYSLLFTIPYVASLVPTGGQGWPHVVDYNVPLSGTLISNPSEQRSLRALVEIILTEQQLHGVPANSVVESLMKTILNLLDRYLAQHSVSESARLVSPSAFIQRVLTYIGQHITEPQLLRMENMAEVFNYSASHLAALFKQQVGESIQQYIIQYKLNRVATRLSLSTLTISQIADEFGFSDVCHLNKLFKRHYQYTPTDYRRSLAVS
ncbi:AraC family transcriptional regulator [Siphonobacter sp. BAB-5405]|uniref:AraC family transcriptional regulator n=1 Tax=Siphonobacter sp. BAB-5405 TaxID=1864825 RepID=UPI000C80C4F1|nr:AraC family transcriptional regulator [Siphonobacter sp. BAB-5405]PMD92314.1 AraC family transcriptional regulator [Siphonobacter sp. BAB-5405]